MHRKNQNKRIMSEKEFNEFMATLVPMKSHSDNKAINANYRKILAKGFRCSRKEKCYIHPSGRKITWRYTNGQCGEFIWTEIK